MFNTNLLFHERVNMLFCQFPFLQRYKIAYINEYYVKIPYFVSADEMEIDKVVS